MRLRLTIAYDGRAFTGWQSQAHGKGVQDAVERAFATVLKLPERPRVCGSGRTDAGVHALAQIAHVDVPDTARLPMDAWRRALNVNMPHAVRIMEIEPAAHRFHAQYDALSKTYAYRIWNAPVLPPHDHGRAWHMSHDIDPALLHQAAEMCSGTHDFASFAANRGDPADNPTDTSRTIFHIRPTLSPGGLWTLEFHGTGFLYKMVRMLTASIIRVARHRAPPTWLAHLLTAPPGEKTNHVAPPDGLTLMAVHYPPATPAL